MKYVQPYGVSDPDASYINGNPSTGTMGSIPPAESIEHPQREIINLIKDSGLVPDGLNLHQSSSAVQSGKVNYAQDSGVKNNYVVSVNPALTAYKAGQRWSIRVQNTNQGPATLNINGLGPRAIVYPSGGPLVGNEMLEGAVVTLVDDGSKLQLQNAVSNMLSAPKDYYVNASIGSDTVYDGTTATVSGAHGPFQSIQQAINSSLLWNQNGFNVGIHIADGVYAPFVTMPINGAGYIQITGNINNPGAVLIHSTAGECVFSTADNYQLQGMKLQADTNGSPPHFGAGIRVTSGSIGCNAIDFGDCCYAHMFVQGGAHLSFFGEVPPLTHYYTVSGNSPVHCYCYQNATVYFEQKINIVGARNITTWAICMTGGNMTMVYAQVNYQAGATVTGKKFDVQLNGTLITGGAGVGYLPGTIPGTTATGGQYQ